MRPVDKKPPSGKNGYNSGLGPSGIARRFGVLDEGEKRSRASALAAARKREADDRRDAEAADRSLKEYREKGGASLEAVKTELGLKPKKRSQAVARSRAKNPEKYRERQKEYMRKKREREKTK